MRALENLRKREQVLLFDHSSYIHKLLFLMMSICAMSLSAQTRVNVSSLEEMREAVQKSGQIIVLAPGNYNIEDLPSEERYFPCSGSHNTIVLSGVYIDFPVGSSEEAHFQMTGDDNTLRGGIFENTYANGLKEISDFIAYNNDKESLAFGADPHILIRGSNTTVVGVKMIVRGSFPYGYGSIYGIGRDNKFGLDKRGGIAVQGPNTIIDSCELQMRAFGHGIYIQRPADNTVIKNTLVEGVVRLGSDMLADRDSSSLPFRSNFLAYNHSFKNPGPIPVDRMYSLCEDGIRVYTGGGSAHVENCTVKKMRGGIRLYLASSASVSNSKAMDCGATNYNMPAKGSVKNSSGNFSYAPLNDFRLGRNGQNIELTLIPSPNATGAHNVADVKGSNHSIVFHRSPGPIDSSAHRPIVVSGNNSIIRNETEYPMVLESSAGGNTIVSLGKVIDHGTNNSITYIQ